MTWLTWCMLLGGVLLNAAAQLLLKAATRHSGELVTDSGQISWSSVMQLLGAVPLLIGLACYAVRLVV